MNISLLRSSCFKEKPVTYKHFVPTARRWCGVPKSLSLSELDLAYFSRVILTPSQLSDASCAIASLSQTRVRRVTVTLRRTTRR